MGGLRHALATAAVHRAAYVSVALVAGSSPDARAAVAVRAVEVGNRGQVTPAFPAAVRAEISTDARLEGTFHAWVDVPPPPPGDRDLVPALSGHSASVSFLLEAGETRRVTAHLADLPDDACDAHVRWSLADATGRPLAEGAQPIRCVRQRVLFLTDAAVPSARRSPSAAFDEVQSYSEYTTCVISGRDFAALRQEQRETLLDRTSLGSTLVLTAPLATAGAELDRRLAAAEALVWRDAAGRELREVPLHLGVVRAVDLPLPELERALLPRPPGNAPETPLGRLLMSDGPVLPHADESDLRRHPFRGVDWGWLRPPGDATGVSRVVTTAGFTALGLVLVGMWWASRPRVATSARAVWAGAAALALSPALAYLAAAPTRAGNGDECWDLALHDGPGGRQSRWSRASLGGGGGREDPLLRSPAGPRSIWSAFRAGDLERSVKVEEGTDGHLRLGPGRRGLSCERLVVVQDAESNPDEPAWDAGEIAVREGHLAGTLRARRPFARLAIVGPPGVAWFGSLRLGERIDVSVAHWSEPRLDWGRAAGPPVERVASELWNIQFGRRHPALFYAVGAESSACTIATAGGGEPPAPCTVHVQPLGMDPAAELTGVLPAEREAGALRVHVPEALRERMRSRGLSFVPDVPFLEASRPPDVSPDVVDGFRQVVFRVGGAPSGGVWSTAGPGLTLGRWRPAATRRP
jgi:hypothetical protein